MSEIEAAQREREIFHQALDLESGQRLVYLTSACAGDPALLERVQRLLRAHEQASDFLPSHGGTSPPALLPAEKIGDVIDNYKLVERIGEGGCGIVYFAEQKEPVRRGVALKIIKLGMDTQSVIGRYR